MNIVLWVLQVILALHTLMGAIWKFSKSAAETMPSLKAIPPAAWSGMCVLELVCVVCLLIPAMNKSLGFLVPIAALFIAAEMILFCALHLSSGATAFGPLAYWLVVAVVCGFIAFGRLMLAPF